MTDSNIADTLNEKPDDPQANLTMAEDLEKQGFYASAIDYYQRALATPSEQAWIGLGRSLHQTHAFEAAEDAFMQALQCNEHSDQAFYNLSKLKLILGEIPEAIECSEHALMLKPDVTAYKSVYAQALKMFHFSAFDLEAKESITRCLADPDVYHLDLRQPWLSLYLLDPAAQPFLDLVKIRDPEAFYKAFDIQVLAPAVNDPYLTLGLQNLTVVAIFFEYLLMKSRRALLQAALDGQDISSVKPFLVSLAFYNDRSEYIADESDEEKNQIDALKQKIETGDLSPELIALYASYRSLLTLQNRGDVQTLAEKQDGVLFASLIHLQITEPLERADIAVNIKGPESLDDDVSKAVRAQYEENPYPRWKIMVPHKLPENLERMGDGMKILIAGCGTGKQAITIAMQFPTAQVRAIDLSRNSISYAIQRSREIGLENTTFEQADILSLTEWDEDFDMIASTGVLHHMDDPIKGWRALRDRLRPGGIMNIALYSEIARQSVVASRQWIADKGYRATIDDIRRFRKDVLELAPDNPDFMRLLQVPDFYTTSECRDLVFHVSEKRYTLPELDYVMKDLDLDLIRLGTAHAFEVLYQKLFPDDPERLNLHNWDIIEKENPMLFAGMYNFWCCKKGEKGLNQNVAWIPQVASV